MSEQRYTTPEGEKRARVVHVVRAGKHTPRFDKFDKGPTPRLWLTYELLDEQNDEGKNRWMTYAPYGEPINSFFTDRGKQAEWLSAIGVKGDNSPEALASVPGMPVWLDVVHNTNPKTGITYANIDDVSKVRQRDADDFPEMVNQPIFFDLYNPVKEDYMALPKWIRDYIAKAEDLEEINMAATLKAWDDEAYEAYKAANGGAQSKAQAPTPAPEPKKDPNPDEYDDDVPF